MPLVLLLSLLVGCRSYHDRHEAAVDSIFYGYHHSNSAFDADDASRLLHFADSVQCHYGQVLGHLDMASLAIVRGNNGEALRHLDQVDLRSDDPPFAHAYTDFIYGLSNQYTRDLSKAIRYYTRSATAFEALRDTQPLVVIYTNLSEIHAENGDWELRQACLDKVRSLTADNLVHGYSLLADSVYTLIHQGFPEQALGVWQRQHQEFVPRYAAQQLQFPFVYNHYDQAQSIYYSLWQLDSALAYNDTLRALVDSLPGSAVYADVLLMRAKIMHYSHRYQEAVDLCLSIIDQASDEDLPAYALTDVYTVLICCYSHLGMLQKAEEAGSHYRAALQRNARYHDQMEQRYELLLDRQRQQSVDLRLRLLVVAVAALVLILALLLVVIYKQRRQRIEQTLRLMSEQELDAAQRQLADSQMRQAKIQEQILTYTEQMRQLASDMPKPLRGKTFLNLEQIRRQRDADAWESFEQAFAQEHDGFKSRLAELCPRLNATDVKICMLMRIGMSSRDIANMLHLTPETLRTYRYSLRKKLNLPPGTTLEAFVGSL